MPSRLAVRMHDWHMKALPMWRSQVGFPQVRHVAVVGRWQMWQSAVVTPIVARLKAAPHIRWLKVGASG